MWIAGLLATLMGGLNALFLARLAGLFGGGNVVGFVRSLGGRVAAVIVGAVFFGFALTVASVSLRDFSELMVTAFFQETPLLVFSIVMALLVSWAAYEGLEVIARMAQFLLPLTLAGILFSSILSLPQGGGIKNFLPVMEEGWGHTLRGGITQWALFGDVAVWLILLPYLDKSTKNYRFMPLSIVLAGALLEAVLLFIINGLGAGVATRQTYPFLTLVSSVTLAGFVERIEGGFLIIWVAANFMKITVFYFAALVCLRLCWDPGKRYYVVLPLTLVMILQSILMFNSYHSVRMFLRPETYAVVASVVFLAVPVMAGLLWAVRTRMGRVRM